MVQFIMPNSKNSMKFHQNPLQTELIKIYATPVSYNEISVSVTIVSNLENISSLPENLRVRTLLFL